MIKAIRNQIDRFDLVIDAIDQVPTLRVAGAHVKDKMKNQQRGAGPARVRRLAVAGAMSSNSARSVLRNRV